MSVAFPFEPYLSAEHPEYIEEVGKREYRTQQPPRDPDRQTVLSGCGVIDGDVASRIGARGKHHWIQSERSSDQHADDVYAGSDEGSLLLALADGPDYHRERRVHQRGNGESDDVVLIVVEQHRTNRNGCDETDEGQQHLERPERERGFAGTPVHL